MKRVLGVKWTSYERLEFYGDAVLGFMASKMLFEECDTDGPHELTIKRQKLVCPFISLICYGYSDSLT